MSILLSHCLGVVIAAEYEKMEKEHHLIVNKKGDFHHRMVENITYNNNNSIDSMTSDSEVSQSNDTMKQPKASSSCCSQLDMTTDVKRKRPKYSDDQQRRIIEIYDSFSCKVMAMKAINQMYGFENIYKRKIERWKRSNKSMGRPVSREFEMEVIEEYHNTIITINNNINKQQQDEKEKEVNVYMTNSTLKKCALVVFDRQYWDESTKSFVQKWHVDKLTCNLCFTSKWIAGLLKRSKKTLNNSSGSGIDGGAYGGDGGYAIWSDGGGSYSSSTSSSTAASGLHSDMNTTTTTTC